jgi:hypothetical protein
MAIEYEELEWSQVREDAKKLNKEFAAIVDELNPGKKHTFFKFKYKFGDEILQHADLQLPNKQRGLTSFDSPSVPEHVKKALSYGLGSNPVGFLLKNSIELFINLEDRVVPFGIIKPGSIFGLWRILDTGISHCPPTFLWGMTAGARSLFMLPKISETISHSRLTRKFQIKLEKPKTLIDQWAIFKEIANHKEYGESWDVELLFFSGTWFENLHDPAWAKLKLYLLNLAWQGSSYWRNQFIWRFIFSVVHQKRHIKSHPYILDMVRQILAISVGALPGFQPAIDDSLAPIKLLQKIYVEDYGLKKYAPILMQPSFFSMNANSRPVYSSLQYHASMEFSPKFSERTSAITEIHLIDSLINKHLAEIETGKLKISETPLEYVAKKVKFDYFHNDGGNYKELQESTEIPVEDKSFVKATGDYADLPFPKNSSFFNGCIRISLYEK